MIAIEIPGRTALALEILLLDVNGTLSNRGALLDGVEERIAALREHIEPRLLTADTFGTLDSIVERLSVHADTVASGDEKLAVLAELGPERCAAIGNGTNDAKMLAGAALGIAVLGPEGCSSGALAACDLLCSSVLEALDLLRDPRALAASLRT